jgi:hypothetical protein
MSNSTILTKDSRFPFDLPFASTKWGAFYFDYKNQHQNKVRAVLKDMANQLLELKNSGDDNDYREWIKKFFYLSQYNEESEKFETPKRLLKPTGNINKETGLPTEYGATLQMHYRNETIAIAKEYYKLVCLQFKEIKNHYKIKKETNQERDKEHRREHASEKIECPYCKAIVVRAKIARHQKTTKKCIDIQNEIENV